MKIYVSSCLILTLPLLFGCSDSEEVSSSQVTESPVNSATVPDTGAVVSTTPKTETPGEAPVEQDMEFAPLSTSTPSGKTAANGSATASPASLDKEQKIEVTIEKLKPLQVILGNWRGTTRREYAGFKAVDNHEWIWDLQTDPSQPALKLDSDKSPYLRKARLTWDVETQTFNLTATDNSDVTREFTGDYTDPVHEIIGPDDKLHRVFRLELTQSEDSLARSGGERWQIAFVQQENNRYLLEVARRRGKASFKRYDTVSTQREGTSFAISDSDYGEKTCIISQGLGTISVSYQGKSYWVCCSGCKAAFEEDPETWIARAKKQASEK